MVSVVVCTSQATSLQYVHDIIYASDGCIADLDAWKKETASNTYSN